MEFLFAILVSHFAFSLDEAALDQTGMEDSLNADFVLTIVGTNDIHGNFNTHLNSQNQRLGGFDWFKGYMNALKNHVHRHYGEQGGLVLLDAGDAAQGTIYSNKSEGALAVKVMNRIGYTAAVFGNHGFDFGPKGEEWDECFGRPGCNSLESLQLNLMDQALFPFIAANVFYKNTRGAHKKGQLFTKWPYVIVPFQGRGVAIIGLESPSTPSTTIKDNVKDLKFTSGQKEVLQLVQMLKEEEKADIFIIVAHEGHQYLEQLKGAGIDAAVVGHTHRVEPEDSNSLLAREIPYIQSGSNGERFGIIQLALSKNSKGKLVVQKERTRLKPGIAIVPQEHYWMGQKVVADKDIQKIIQTEVDKTKAEAEVVLAATNGVFKRGRLQHRIADSYAGNLIADLMGESFEGNSRPKVVLINSGDIRREIPQGDKTEISYNDLYNALPKNLRFIRVPNLPMSYLVSALELSIKSCGRRGVMQISGITVAFERDCRRAVNKEDPQAKLFRVTTTAGDVLWEDGQSHVPIVDLVTTCFVFKNSGAGFRMFEPIKNNYEPGRHIRKTIAGTLSEKGQVNLSDFKPGRYVNCLVPNETKPVGSKIFQQACN